MKSGSRNLLEHSGPHRACYGTPSPLPLLLPLHGGVRLRAFLTLNLLTTTIVEPPSNASKWQMGFNSAFKGLIVASHGYEWLPSRLGRFDSWEGRVKLGDPGRCEVKKISPPLGVRTSIPETSYYTQLSQ